MTGARKPYPGSVRAEAIRLRQGEGIGYAELSRRLGVPRNTVFRWLNPDYAERTRKRSLEAKKRRTGICLRCGGTTKLNDQKNRAVLTHPNGASLICANCQHELEHESRQWTPEAISTRLVRLAIHLGRTPTSTDSFLYYGARTMGLSRARTLEATSIPPHLRPPGYEAVRREFGSWPAAVRAAGLPQAPRGTPSHRCVAG